MFALYVFIDYHIGLVPNEFRNKLKIPGKTLSLNCEQIDGGEIHDFIWQAFFV